MHKQADVGYLPLPHKTKHLSPEQLTELSERAREATQRRAAMHTPGPWHVVPASTAKRDYLWIYGDTDEKGVAANHHGVVAEVNRSRGGKNAPGEGWCNADLIAAAPDLLAALKALLAAADSPQIRESGYASTIAYADAHAEARAVIKKAEGK